MIVLIKDYENILKKVLGSTAKINVIPKERMIMNYGKFLKISLSISRMKYILVG
jgi:hypothetical protein